MISRWFIGVSAKSKGFFKGFTRYNGDKPSFTKQSALATSYNSEDDAKAGIDKYIKTETDAIEKHTNLVSTLTERRLDWDNMTDDDKILFLREHDIRPEYNATRTSSWGSGTIYTTRLSLYAYGKRPGKKARDLDKEELSALDNVKWDDEIYRSRESLEKHKARLKFLKEKLVVREQDLEFKFLKSERRPIKWDQRSDDDTSNSYCNACGYAVPGITQLVIGKWKTLTVICSICMGRLADEAKIHADNVSEEIAEHYATDRFLRSMD
jgi:hypothetical protein